MKVSRIRKGLLFAIAASGLGLGCELIVDFDRTKIPVEGTDSATPTADAATDAPTDTSVEAEPPACNNVPFLGPAVSVNAALGAPPPPTGGTIVPGSYALTQITQYNAEGGVGPTGLTLRNTTTITATTLDSIESTGASDGGVISTLREDGTYVVTGVGDAGAVVLTRACPGTGTSSYGYSANGSTLELYAPDPSTVRVFTKQP